MDPATGSRKIIIFILLAGCVWICSFYGFLNGRYVLTADAANFYQYTKFFLDQVKAGTYPLWNPDFSCGIPNEFFLRRIGDCNPLYSLIIVLMWAGCTFARAYLIFLVSYYFLGLIGFYKLAQELFKDQTASLTALLLLAFSSLGADLFYNFLMLLFVPSVWFFYFLFSFSRNPKSHHLIGMTFSLMVILTTYIPFYFLTIFLSFCLFYSVFYFETLVPLAKRYAEYCKTHKFVSVCCALALGVAFLPGVLFFVESHKGNFVMPIRHFKAPEQSVLSVGALRLKEPGVLSLMNLDRLVSGLKGFSLNWFYVPVFVFPVLILGCLTRTNRRVLFILTWSLFMCLVGSPEASGLHGFLYEHVFFFKYFRNLRFFLWLVLLRSLSCSLLSNCGFCWSIRSERKSRSGCWVLMSSWSTLV